MMASRTHLIIHEDRATVFLRAVFERTSLLVLCMQVGTEIETIFPGEPTLTATPSRSQQGVHRRALAFEEDPTLRAP